MRIYVAVASALGLLAIETGGAHAAPIRTAQEAISRAQNVCFGQRIPKDTNWYAKREWTNYPVRDDKTATDIPLTELRTGQTFRLRRYDSWRVWYGKTPNESQCDKLTAFIRRSDGKSLYCMHNVCADHWPPFVPPPPPQ